MFLPAANHVFVEITNTTRHVRLKLHRIGSLRCVMILYHTICTLEGTKIMMIVILSHRVQASGVKACQDERGRGAVSFAELPQLLDELGAEAG